MLGWPGGGVEGVLLKTDRKVKQCLDKPFLRDQSTVKTNAKSQKTSTLPAGETAGIKTSISISKPSRDH
jgi:hypothetical protein